MRALIVFAKAPLPGQAKTRLVHAGGFDAAFVAQLADAFLRDTVHACRSAGHDRMFFSFTPAESSAYFRTLHPTADLLPQSDGDLGARISGAFEAVFAVGATRAVVLGCDTPHLDPHTIDEAFAKVADAPGVIGPTSDGGFYLIGLRQRVDGLFARIDWSTSRVFAQTRDRARESGLELACLRETFDVDGPEDLERLRALLRLDPESCPHTRRVLDGRPS